MTTATLFDALPTCSLQQVTRLNDALVLALRRGTNKSIKAVRCYLKDIAESAAACQHLFRALRDSAPKTCQTVQERLHLLYIFNDLLYWSGEAPPAELLSALKPSLLQHLRAVFHAPSVTDAIQAQVTALLALWEQRANLEPMTLVGIRAGLAIKPKEGQYAFPTAAGPASETLPEERMPATLTLGAVDQPYWELPASLLLDGLPPPHEREEQDIQGLSQVITARCRGGQQFGVTPELIAAAEAYLNRRPAYLRFPENEEDEPSQAEYEGWYTTMSHGR